MNCLSSLNCQKTFYGGDGPFFSWWVFLVAQGTNEVDESPTEHCCGQLYVLAPF